MSQSKGYDIASAHEGVRWTAQEILDILAQHRETLREMGVRKIGLFGSYRRGTFTADSDMDFLVVLEQPSFDGYMDVKFF